MNIYHPYFQYFTSFLHISRVFSLLHLMFSPCFLHIWSVLAPFLPILSVFYLYFLHIFSSILSGFSQHLVVFLLFYSLYLCSNPVLLLCLCVNLLALPVVIFPTKFFLVIKGFLWWQPRLLQLASCLLTLLWNLVTLKIRQMCLCLCCVAPIFC